MPEVRRRQLAASAGLAFVALDALALFLPGRPPKASDSARHLADALAAHRSEVLVGLYLVGLAVIALPFFLGSVRSWLAREGADEGPAIAATGGAIVAVGAQLIGLVLFYGAAFKVAGQGQDAVVRALTDGGNAGIEISKFGFATFIAGVCLAGGDALPSALRRSGLVSVAALTVSAVALFSEGRLTQFGGPLDLAGAAPGILWVAALSVVLVSRESMRATTAEPGLA